jgi:hypothetical protein
MEKGQGGRGKQETTSRKRERRKKAKEKSGRARPHPHRQRTVGKRLQPLRNALAAHRKNTKSWPTIQKQQSILRPQRWGQFLGQRRSKSDCFNGTDRQSREGTRMRPLSPARRMSYYRERLSNQGGARRYYEFFPHTRRKMVLSFWIQAMSPES